jgi:hypothetical protein
MVESPTRQHRAYVLQLDTNSNATVGFYYEIVTLPRLQSLDLRAVPEPIWTAYEIEPMQIRWINGKCIEVVIANDAEHKDTITQRTVAGVSSRMRFVQAGPSR